MAYVPNPPEEHRWKPGQSGNPKGLPKGTRHLSTVIQNLMEDDDFELKLKNGEVLKGAPSRRIAEVMYGLAVSGNVRAADWLAKNGYGIKNVHQFEKGDPVDAVLEKFGLLEGENDRQAETTS